MSVLGWLADKVFGPMPEAPSSCHCWTVREVHDPVMGRCGVIVKPEKHADWCPVGGDRG